MAAMVAILDFQSELISLFFLSTNCPYISYQVLSHLAFQFSRSQDGGHGDLFGLPIEKILMIFYLQVALTLPTMFQVNWHFGSGDKHKTDSDDGGHLVLIDQNDLSYF